MSAARSVNKHQIEEIINQLNMSGEGVERMFKPIGTFPAGSCLDSYALEGWDKKSAQEQARWMEHLQVAAEFHAQFNKFLTLTLEAKKRNLTAKDQLLNKMFDIYSKPCLSSSMLLEPLQTNTNDLRAYAGIYSTLNEIACSPEPEITDTQGQNLTEFTSRVSEEDEREILKLNQRRLYTLVIGLSLIAIAALLILFPPSAVLAAAAAKAAAMGATAGTELAVYNMMCWTFATLAAVATIGFTMHYQIKLEPLQDAKSSHDYSKNYMRNKGNDLIGFFKSQKGPGFSEGSAAAPVTTPTKSAAA